MSKFNIPEEYMEDDFDFGFSSVNEEELNDLLQVGAATTTPDEILDIKSKLDAIIEMNSTCEGATAVRNQYQQLLDAKLSEIEKQIIPLLMHLKKNPDKDYIFWKGKEREAKCQLQIERILSLTREGK